MVSTRTDQTTGQPPQLERRTLGPRLSVSLFGAASWRIVERNFLVYRRSWIVFVAGMVEPVLYLLSIGVGVGQLISGFAWITNDTVNALAALLGGVICACVSRSRSQGM